ncbi:hypothetical protein [Neisseria animalis]|uniref:Lipoprotein n=1 Tax=Neisseria animalis TaxID=492 RepID=A0A5P3MNZ5_NEIAN|nr:hypothetical protein [Neisseria animalis]QEY23218.1 hypothetical protein D0T90_00740 [Neisseria animalis]ROW31793.1 hypothetical protein CGZ60_08455 [Neisseria animalis]VEE08411.1 Uncharacterised protein [Neisseria animalis]
MKKILTFALAAVLLGACSHYSPVNRPCETQACKKHGTWDACIGNGCGKDLGYDSLSNPSGR